MSDRMECTRCGAHVTWSVCAVCHGRELRRLTGLHSVHVPRARATAHLIAAEPSGPGRPPGWRRFDRSD